MLSDFEDEEAEFRWITQQAKETGRPVWFLLTDRPSDPERYKRLLKGVHAARAQGAPVAAQVAGRPVGVILGVATSFNPFSIRPSWRPLDNLTVPERMKRLQDPALRAALLSEQPTAEIVARMNPFHQIVTTRWDRMYVMGTPPDYEPPPEKSVANIAARSNHTPDEVAFDYLTESADNFLFLPVTGYVHGDLGAVRDMLTDSATILGLSDGGAHCGQIMDASVPTYMLTHWTRDRSRGPKLPLERVVQMQTNGTASFFGFHDRGRLAPGLRADVNVIDYDGLRLHAPEIVHDLPAGGRRLVQRVDGYTATLVAGTPVFEHGQSTGAMPGKLVRSKR
jgi:N-acyl-D-aspartate/D-glutamate deacylase